MAGRGRVQSVRGRGGRGGVQRGADAGDDFFGDQHFDDVELAGLLRGRPAPRRAAGGAASCELGCEFGNPSSTSTG